MPGLLSLGALEEFGDDGVGAAADHDLGLGAGEQIGRPRRVVVAGEVASDDDPRTVRARNGLERGLAAHARPGSCREEHQPRSGNETAAGEAVHRPMDPGHDRGRHPTKPRGRDDAGQHVVGCGAGTGRFGHAAQPLTGPRRVKAAGG